MIRTTFTTLFLVAAATSVGLAQTAPFKLLGPTLVDYSRLRVESNGSRTVHFTGTGFVPQMLLVGRVGPIGPFVVPFRYVDSSAIEFVVPLPLRASTTFQLYKIDNGSIRTTPVLHTQFEPGGASLAPNAVFVAPTGDDGDPGTLQRPFRTIDRGIAALSPGMTLYVRGGTYRERPVIDVSGTAADRITIQAFPGERVVVDSGPAAFRTAGNQDWVLHDAAIGEYRSVAAMPSGAAYGYVAGVPGYENERVGLVPYQDAACFRATSEDYVDALTPFYVGPGLFRDPATGRLHVRLQKTADVRAVEARYGRVFAAERPDPRDFSIIVSQASSTLRITGSHLFVRDLVVHQARNSIDMPSTVEDILLDNVEVWLGDSAIECDGAGSHHVTVARCKVYGDNPLWIFWTDAKRDPAPANLMRQTSIDFRNGAHDVELAYNHVRGGHDLIGVNTDERDFFVHHNLLENCHDDAAELEGDVDIGRIEFHHNQVRNALVAISPGQDTPVTTGPMLFHHNVFALLRDPPVNRSAGIVSWNGGGRHGFEYMLKQHSGNTFYYNNTMVLLGSDGRGINLTPRRPEGTYCVNNVLIVVNDNINGSYRTGSGQIVDGNLYWRVNSVDSSDLVDDYDTVPRLFAATGLERHGLGHVPGRGTDPRFVAFDPDIVDTSASTWVLEAASETPAIDAFRLLANSPARGVAVPVPVHPTFGWLPDIDSSGDLGALPYGASMREFQGFPFR